MCILVVSGFAGDDTELTKLDENVYARIASPDGNAVGNSGVVILDRSVLVFDTHFTPEAGAALRDAISAVTSKPVRYVVNSHWHADHTHGNQEFENAHLIASADARRDVIQLDLPSLNRTIKISRSQMKELNQELSKTSDADIKRRLRDQIKAREDYLNTLSRLKIVPPSVTLDDSLTLQEGDQEVQLLFLGKGHTDGDIILYLPSRKIAFLGSLYFNKAIPSVQDATLLEWIKTLNAVLQLNAEKFVPGHGSVGNKQDVEDFLGYLRELRSLVEAAIERGESLEQATREIMMPEKYSSYQFQNLFPSNVQKMYSEIKALQQDLTQHEEPPKADSKEPAKEK
ncbi:MAG: MBL fold metallo-hydrolase [Acidobacteria bacterium]|nr:MBL fold metallo-hydrolase [Acidobacteriota bacterium]